MSPQSSNPFSDPPQPPPKNRQHRMPSRPADLENAVVDTVTINGRRMGRSNTAAYVFFCFCRNLNILIYPVQNSLPPSKAPQLGPRSQSTDSTPSDKQKLATPKTKKKGSQHEDAIDRLDITGFGPASSSIFIILEICFRFLI